MAIRNQPYLKLYIQDFATDEKLAECSAAANGVFIRIMCLMHKSEEYGKILLKQKDKQSDKQIENFAYKVAKYLPFDFATVSKSLQELVEEHVLTIDGDCLFQKRMVKDAALSDTRGESGSKGGKNSVLKKDFAQASIEAKGKDFAQAKSQASTEYEYDNEHEYDTGKGGMGETPRTEFPKRTRRPTPRQADEGTLTIRMESDWDAHLKKYHDQSYYQSAAARTALKAIKAKLLHQAQEKLKAQGKDQNEHDDHLIIETWRSILANYAKWDDFDKKFTELTQINNRLSNIISSIKNHGQNHGQFNGHKNGATLTGRVEPAPHGTDPGRF